MSPGRLALVTGGNKGLGREVVRQLAERGLTVLLASRDRDRGEAAVRELAGDGVHATAVVLDVTEPASALTAAEQVRRDHGRLDVLVNNAGAFVGAPAAEVTADQVRQMFEVNVAGVVTVVNAFLPLLGRSGAANIVNVSSRTASLALTSAGGPIPGDGERRMAYASSKAALNMLTIHYAQAFRRDPALAHVTINSAVPPWTATDMSGFQGTHSVRDGARIIVELATLGADGPSGGCFDVDGPLPW